MLYDPAEFWEEIRSVFRAEVAKAQAGAAAVMTSLQRAGLPVKPAYTLPDIRRLFQLSEGDLDEWTTAGFLRPTRIGRQFYFLYADLAALFAPRPGSTTPPLKQ
jgi:hypothetical protein